MLLNEFLKEHSQVQQIKADLAKQETRNASQEKEIEALMATLKKQASEIQKVSAQLQLGKPTPQTVAENQ